MERRAGLHLLPPGINSHADILQPSAVPGSVAYKNQGELFEAKKLKGTVSQNGDLAVYLTPRNGDSAV